jgi:peptidoglycan hydrolase CwlO-like protein
MTDKELAKRLTKLNKDIEALQEKIDALDAKVNAPAPDTEQIKRAMRDFATGMLHKASAAGRNPDDAPR